MRRLKGGGELLVLFRIGGDNQDARLASDGSKTSGAIILGKRIARRVHLHVIAIEAGFGKRLRKSKKILACGKLDFLFSEKLIVAIKPDRRGLGLIGLDEDFDLERLRFFELGREL